MPEVFSTRAFPSLEGEGWRLGEKPNRVKFEPSLEKLGGPGLGFLALFGGQILLIYLVQAQLAEVLMAKPEFLFLRVLPGLVWPLALAWLGSAWLARRRPAGPATAVPLGFSLGTTQLIVAGLLIPIFRQGMAQGISAESAGGLAWSASVALTLLVGLVQLMIAPFAHRLAGTLSLSLCLALGAALALVSTVNYLPWLQLHPFLVVAGVLPLAAFVLVGLPRPFALPLGWLVLGAGWVAQVASGTGFTLPDLSGSLLPNWEFRWVEQGLGYLWVQPEFLSVAVPLMLALQMRDLLLLRECQSQPNPPSARSTLLGLGLLNVFGASLGCGLPLSVLPGYLGYKRLGAGQFFSQAAGLFLLFLALLGGFGPVCSWLPLPTLGVVFVAQRLLSAGTSVNLLAAPSGFLLVAAWLPFLMFGGDSRSTLVGLVWGGMAVTLLRGTPNQTAWVCLAGSLLSWSGILHQARWAPDFDPMAGTYLVLAILFRIGHVIRTELPKDHAPPEPVAPDLPSDSSDSHGMSAFGIPGDSRSAEGAGSSHAG